MSSTAYDIIRAAASHYLMGEYSHYFGTSYSGGTTTIFSDDQLVTWTGDRRWQGYHAFFPNRASSRDLERRVYSTALNTGQVQFMNPLSSAVANGEEYWLLRDFSWTQWLSFLNDACRSLFFDQEIVLRGETDLLRYTMPTPVSRPQWMQAVFAAPYPQSFSDAPYPKLRWYRINCQTGSIQGDIVILLEASLAANSQLIFQFARPYAHPHQTQVYSMTRSVLTPFGQSDSISPPLDLFVMALVWRALREKVRNLTGEARDRWKQNLQDAAKSYAECIDANGVKAVSQREIGFSEAYMTYPGGVGWGGGNA